jgi:hypothetical protein
VQVRMLAAGRDTVLGDAAAEEQLFLTGDYEDIALADISGGQNINLSCSCMHFITFFKVVHCCVHPFP